MFVEPTTLHWTLFCTLDDADDAADADAADDARAHVCSPFAFVFHWYIERRRRPLLYGHANKRRRLIPSSFKSNPIYLNPNEFSYFQIQLFKLVDGALLPNSLRAFLINQFVKKLTLLMRFHFISLDGSHQRNQLLTSAD